MTTYSTNLRLMKQASGTNAGTWGDNLNDSVIELIDTAVAGYKTIAVGGGSDTTLSSNDGSADDSRFASLEFTGLLTGNKAVVAPDNDAKIYALKTSITGSYDLTFKNTSGSGQVLTPGSNQILVTDGSTCTIFSAPTSSTGKLHSDVLTSVALTGVSVHGSETVFTSGSLVSVSITGAEIKGGTVSVTTITAESTVSFYNTVSVSGATIGHIVTHGTNSGDITISLQDANFFIVNMTGNCSLTIPNNPASGQAGIIYFIKDSTPGHTLSYASCYKFPSGQSIVLTSAANAVDLLSYFVRDTSPLTIDIVGAVDIK